MQLHTVSIIQIGHPPASVTGMLVLRSSRDNIVDNRWMTFTMSTVVCPELGRKLLGRRRWHAGVLSWMHGVRCCKIKDASAASRRVKSTRIGWLKSAQLYTSLPATFKNYETSIALYCARWQQNETTHNTNSIKWKINSVHGIGKHTPNKPYNFTISDLPERLNNPISCCNSACLRLTVCLAEWPRQHYSWSPCFSRTTSNVDQ